MFDPKRAARIGIKKLREKHNNKLENKQLKMYLNNIDSESDLDSDENNFPSKRRYKNEE